MHINAGEPSNPREGAAANSPLRLHGVSKSFTGTRVLSGIDLDVRPGEIHAIIGQNGSGKSTLVKILAGFHRPEPGSSAESYGRLVRLGDSDEAHRAGWRFVHQDLGLVSALDTVDNLALGFGYDTTRLFRIRWRRELAAAREAIAQLGYRFDVRKQVGKLAPIERTAVAIARALQDVGDNTSLLVLDEPTATMPRGEVDRLLALLARLKERGVAVLYISHHVEEVLEAADRVTVFRDGVIVGTRRAADVTKRDLVKMMTGVTLDEFHPTKDGAGSETSAPLLEFNNVSGQQLRSMTARIYPGEVVGVAGMTGSGRDELCGLLFGGRPRGGKVSIASKELLPMRPDAAVALGVGYVPASRTTEGLLMSMSIRENLTLVDLSAYWRRARLRHRAERNDVAALRAEFSIRGSRDESAVSSLSGGNQQKVCLGKWLRLKPPVLLLDEPTQGVDVGSQAEIHGMIDKIASQGSAVLICSSDERELERLCSRVLVLRHGVVALELAQERVRSALIVQESLGATDRDTHGAQS